MVDVSVEYSHIYTSQAFSSETAASIDMARLVVADLTTKGQTWQGVVMIDDYSPGGYGEFDYARFLQRLAQKDAPGVAASDSPAAIIHESDLLATNALTLQGLATNDHKQHRQLVRYIGQHGQKHPCSLFVASWYLVRLGFLPDPTGKIQPATRLVNILPVRFQEPENAARKIIAAVAGEATLANIVNVYMQDDAPSPGWDAFDPEAYVYSNYATPHAFDLYVLAALVERYRTRQPRQVLELGAGACLFPILAALPFTREVTALEYGAGNLAYLLRQAERGLDPIWEPYMQVINAVGRLAWTPADYLDRWRAGVRVMQGSIYELPSDARYDAVSMHYVAESISDSREDFEAAVRAFVGAARVGGMLLATFMENSHGYEVGNRRFPAYPVDLADVRELLADEDMVCERVPTVLSPLRAGNRAVLCAFGTRRGAAL